MKILEVKKEDFKNNIEIIKKINEQTASDDAGNKPIIIAVVKGNGMGLDLIKYSKFLIENGINNLAVATVEEALKLREAGIEEKVLMLSSITDEDEIKALIDKKITLTIGSAEALEKVNSIANKQDAIIPVHLKIDTGFGRYGFLYNRIDELTELLKQAKKIKIEGTFTHFSKSFDEKWTTIQFNRFINAVSILKNNNIDCGILHVCNSTAFLKYPNMRLNAVRIGSAFQGRITVENSYGLKKLGILKAKVAEIKELPKNFNISYMNKYKTREETKVAVIPVGHMDGFNIVRDKDSFRFIDKIVTILSNCKRLFINQKLRVTINNKNCYVLGTVGMYHIIVDITGKDINIGDEVIIETSPILTNPLIERKYV